MEIHRTELLARLLDVYSVRHRVIAQNVANASTAGFTPSDLKPFQGKTNAASPVTLPLATGPAKASDGISLSTPSDSHSQSSASKKYTSMATPDSETTLNGNQVVLEEQMLKMSESRSDYDAAIGFYQKSMDLLHLALKKPGG